MAAIDKRLTITQAQVVGLTTELARKVDTTDPRLDGDGGGGALPELQDQTVLAAPPGGGEAAETGLGPHLSIDDGALLMTGDWTASYIIQSQPAAHRRAKLEGRSQDLLFGTQPEFLPNAQAIADLPTGYLRGETGTGVISSAPTIPAGDIVGTVAPGAHHATHEAGGSDAVTLAQSQVTGLTTALVGKVDTTDPRLSDARAPTAHHTTHEPGGSDPLAVNAAAATGSLRTLGTTATAACAGNDARLSDARTPTAHHASHETGGSDAIAALSAAVLTSGTLPDARLSANVQMKPLAVTDLPAHHTRHEPGGADAIVALDASVLTSGTLNAARLPAGTVNTSGTPAANQIALFVDADTVTGTPNLLWSPGVSALDLVAGRIHFPGAQNPSSDLSTLDDYREGPWTPFIGGVNGQSGQSYGTVAGTFTKIGRRVTANFWVSLLTKGTITGDLVIGGLPIACGDAAGAVTTALLWNALATPWVSVVGLMQNGNNVIFLRGTSAASTSNNTPLTAADVTNTTLLIGTVTYLATN